MLQQFDDGVECSNFSSLTVPLTMPGDISQIHILLYCIASVSHYACRCSPGGTRVVVNPVVYSLLLGRCELYQQCQQLCYVCYQYLPASGRPAPRTTAHCFVCVLMPLNAKVSSSSVGL